MLQYTDSPTVRCQRQQAERRRRRCYDRRGNSDSTIGKTTSATRMPRSEKLRRRRHSRCPDREDVDSSDTDPTIGMTTTAATPMPQLDRRRRRPRCYDWEDCDNSDTNVMNGSAPLAPCRNSLRWITPPDRCPKPIRSRRRFRGLYSILFFYVL